MSYYRKVPSGCCIPCLGLTPTIERNNKQNNPHPDCRRVVRSHRGPTFLHSKSAMRTALPHLLPCTQHIVRRYATTATSGSTCSSPQHHATARLLLPSCTYSPAAQRYTAGDASAVQGKDVRFLSRNVLALLDVRGLQCMYITFCGIEHHSTGRTHSTAPTSTGVKAASHDSTPRLPAMSRNRIRLARQKRSRLFSKRNGHVSKSINHGNCFERSGLYYWQTCGVSPDVQATQLSSCRLYLRRHRTPHWQYPFLVAAPLVG